MTSSSRRSLRSALTFAFCLALLVPVRASAQPAAPAHEPTAQELETARSLYKEGKELRAAGDLSGAIEKLQAAHALGNTPVTGIELARAYEAAGKLVEAREVALSIGHIPVASDEREKSAEARVDAAKLAEDLRARIPTIRAKVTGLAPGEAAHLTIDGAAVPDVALAEPQKVNPGQHTMVLHVGDGASARDVRAEIGVIEGRSVEVLLEVPPPPATQVTLPPVPPRAQTPAPAAAPAEGPTHPGMPTLAKVGFAVAGAGAAAGVITGLIALAASSNLSSECGNHVCTTGSAGAADLDSARSAATLSTISFAIAGAGLALGIVSLVTAHDSTAATTSARVAPWLGPGAAGIHGSF